MSFGVLSNRTLNMMLTTDRLDSQSKPAQSSSAHALIGGVVCCQCTTLLENETLQCVCRFTQAGVVHGMDVSITPDCRAGLNMPLCGCAWVSWKTPRLLCVHRNQACAHTHAVLACWMCLIEFIVSLILFQSDRCSVMDIHVWKLRCPKQRFSHQHPPSPQP